MIAGFSEVLKGSGGSYELNRVVGFAGGVGFIFGTLSFQAWNMANGHPFDVVSFCAAFAGGIALLSGGSAAAVALKDRNVATAEVIKKTGAVPVAAPAGPRVDADDIQAADDAAPRERKEILP